MALSRRLTPDADGGGRSTPDPVTAPGLSSVHRLIVASQGQVGNGAVSRRLAGTQPVQVHAALAGRSVAQRDKSDAWRRASYRERGLRSLRAAQHGPDTYARMLALAGGDGAARLGLQDASDTITAETDALRDRDDVLYGNPPLNRIEGLRRLSLIERGSDQALAGIERNHQALNVASGMAVRQEWGLGIARTAGGEAFIIIGDRTGVSWPPEIVACLTPIAHSHPYFEAGKPRNRYGGVSTATKEIADHDIGGQPTHGAVPWSQLANRSESEEMQKIFPSASDVGFASKKGVRNHIVFTPYLVLDHPSGTVIANMGFGGARFRDASRLRFEIRGAHHISGTAADYRCDLVAFADDTQFWQRVITTNGDGQFSPLVW